MAENLSNKTDAEIDDILRRAENVDVSGSLHQRALIEKSLRTGNNNNFIIGSVFSGNGKGGIFNAGTNTQIIGNQFINQDRAIVNVGENMRAENNIFEKSVSPKKWWEKTWVQALSLLGALASIIGIIGLIVR